MLGTPASGVVGISSTQRREFNTAQLGHERTLLIRRWANTFCPGRGGHNR